MSNLKQVIDNVLIVNIGGPRSKKEIYSFLKSEFHYQEVSKKLPNVLRGFWSSLLAKIKSYRQGKDYSSIGGFSPIWFETEQLISLLSVHLGKRVTAFYSYLIGTHAKSYRMLRRMAKEGSVVVFPMFAQYSFSTIGSVASLLEENLSKDTLRNIKWITSYYSSKAYIDLLEDNINAFCNKFNFIIKDTIFIWVATGINKVDLDNGDQYFNECVETVNLIKDRIKEAQHILTFHKRFTYKNIAGSITEDVCETLKERYPTYSNVLFVPVSFISENIEIMFAIDNRYLPLLQSKGYFSARISALASSLELVKAMMNILETQSKVTNCSLVKK